MFVCLFHRILMFEIQCNVQQKVAMTFLLRTYLLQQIKEVVITSVSKTCLFLCMTAPCSRKWLLLLFACIVSVALSEVPSCTEGPETSIFHSTTLLRISCICHLVMTWASLSFTLTFVMSSVTTFKWQSEVRRRDTVPHDRLKKELDCAQAQRQTDRQTDLSKLANVSD